MRLLLLFGFVIHIYADVAFFLRACPAILDSLIARRALSTLHSSYTCLSRFQSSVHCSNDASPPSRLPLTKSKAPMSPLPFS